MPCVITLAELASGLPLRTLSLTQPWATLMALGAKLFETRSWSLSYRGILAIHASKGFPGWARDYCERPIFREVLAAAGYRDWKALPTGRIVSVGELMDIHRTEKIFSSLTEQEMAFGNYAAGRYAWETRGMRRLEEPLPVVSGTLGLWTWFPGKEQTIEQKGAKSAEDTKQLLL